MAIDALISAVIEILTGSIVGMADALGTGISTIIQDIFFVTPEGGTEQLSVMGIFILLFCGLSLAFSLFRLMLNWICSLGKGGV